MQDGIVVKGLAPKPLNPCKYHINPRTDLSKLEEGMPWRTIAAWAEHSTTTTNLDAPLLRLMLSLACAPDTTW